MGFVFFANYFKFCERARHSLLGEFSTDHSEMISKYNMGFVVKRTSCDYKKPVKFGDKIEIHTTIEKCSVIHLKTVQKIINQDGDNVANVETDLVCIDLIIKKPRKMEKNLYNAIKGSCISS